MRRSLLARNKRILVGRAMRSDRLGDPPGLRQLALPIFASDALSSVAYAPDEILIMLGLLAVPSPPCTRGRSRSVSSWLGGHRRGVLPPERPCLPGPCGGDYEVATENLGPKAGLTVALALLVDYVLTVAVSISSGVQNARAALPFISGHEVVIAVGLIVLLMAMNLRGVRESGKAFAISSTSSSCLASSKGVLNGA